MLQKYFMQQGVSRSRFAKPDLGRTMAEEESGPCRNREQEPKTRGKDHGSFGMGLCAWYHCRNGSALP